MARTRCSPSIDLLVRVDETIDDALGECGPPAKDIKQYTGAHYCLQADESMNENEFSIEDQFAELQASLHLYLEARRR